MKDMWEKERKMHISLQADRVFYAIRKNDKVEIIIANKDFTKFRTLDQLLAMEGETEVHAIKRLHGDWSERFVLATGEALECSEDDRMDRAGNVHDFTSIGDLKEYEAACQKEHNEFVKRRNKAESREVKENNEKYLEF